MIPARQFFSGPLKQFERTRTWKSASGKKMTGLVEDDTIEAIGEGGLPVIYLECIGSYLDSCHTTHPHA
jgi:hypothetical protein